MNEWRVWVDRLNAFATPHWMLEVLNPGLMPSSTCSPSSSRFESATGLVLRTRPLTETSLIVNWLSPDKGRIATVAKGARRPKSTFHGKVDLFYECDFSFSRSQRSELHSLREVVVRDTHETLRHDLAWVQQASYAAALIEQTTETDTPLPEIHELFSGLLAYLPQQRPAKPRTLFAFELRLLRELGLEPDTSTSRLSTDTKALIYSLTHSEWEELGELKATTAQADAVRQFLHGFLIYHLGKLPKARTAALAH